MVYRRRRRPRRAAFDLISVLLLFFSLSVTAYAQAPEDVKTVLYLNSYHQGYQWGDGLLQAFRERVKGDVEIYVEYMDTKRFFDSAHLDSFLGYLRSKYHAETIDLIVAADDAAYQFAVEREPPLFPQVPRVFVGVSEYDPLDNLHQLSVTGVVQHPPVQEGAALMTRLHPEAPVYVAITDNSFNGRANEDRLEAFAREAGLADRFVFANAMNAATLESIERLLTTVPEGSAIFLSDFHVEPDNTFVDTEEIFSVLRTRPDLPVYIHSGIYLGEGAVGGKIVTPRGEASIMAEMVDRTFRGTPAGEIPIHDEGTAEYIFDARELRRHAIPRSRLPGSSTITNTLLDRLTGSRATLITFLAVIAVLLFLLLAVLAVVRMQRRNAKYLDYERNLFHTFMDQVPDLIYFKDLERRLVRVNGAYVRFVGENSPEELVGKRDEELFPQQLAEQQASEELEILRTGTSAEERLEEHPADNGSVRWVVSRKMPWRDRDGRIRGVVGVSREVTGEIEAQRKLEAALEDRETLLREVHHRTKNNLQLVVSMLNLQKRQFDAPQVLAALDDAQLRVHSMAMLHDHLHKSPEIGEIQLGEYLRSILSHALGLARPGLQVNGSVAADPCLVDLEQGVNLGLIVNELLTNAVKHAFPERAYGSVELTVREEESRVLIQVKDDGVGITEESVASRGRMGMQIVTTLVEQVQGDLRMERDGGTRWELRVPNRRRRSTPRPRSQ